MTPHVVATIALPIFAAAVCMAVALGFYAVGMLRCCIAAWIAAGVVIATPIALAISHQVQRIDWLQVAAAAGRLMQALSGH